MFTDVRKKTLLANWLPWQQGNVYFWFIKLKILLIPSFEKLPSFKVLACSVVEFWAIYWAWGGKHPPPHPVLIGLKQLYFIADETRDFPCIPVLPENFQSAPPVFWSALVTLKSITWLRWQFAFIQLNVVIRTKNSTFVWNDNICIIRENRWSHQMIRAAKAMKIFACSEKIVVYSGALETI